MFPPHFLLSPCLLALKGGVDAEQQTKPQYDINAVLSTSAEHNTIWAAVGKVYCIPVRPSKRSAHSLESMWRWMVMLAKCMCIVEILICWSLQKTKQNKTKRVRKTRPVKNERNNQEMQDYVWIWDYVCSQILFCIYHLYIQSRNYNSEFIFLLFILYYFIWTTNSLTTTILFSVLPQRISIDSMQFLLIYIRMKKMKFN